MINIINAKMPCYALTSLFSLYTFLCFCNICEIMFSAGSLFLYITKQHRNTRAYSLDILIFFSCIVLLVFFFPLYISEKNFTVSVCLFVFMTSVYLCLFQGIISAALLEIYIHCVSKKTRH